MALIELNEVYKLYRSSLEQLVDLVRRLIGCGLSLVFVKVRFLLSMIKYCRVLLAENGQLLN